MGIGEDATKRSKSYASTVSFCFLRIGVVGGGGGGSWGLGLGLGAGLAVGLGTGLGLGLDLGRTGAAAAL